MIIPIYPTKDNTIYEKYPLKNTGLDSILEINKETIDSASICASRILMQFDSDEINDIKSTYINGASCSYYLRLFISDIKEIPEDLTIDIYPISQSWDMGVGKYYDTPQPVSGSSWTYKTGYYGTQWTTASYASSTTGSYLTNPGGGTWYTTPACTASFANNVIEDIRIDVTNIVNKWVVTADIINNGFILKARSEYVTTVSNRDYSIKFFSKDTHTIFQPRLEVCWDDQVYAPITITNTTYLYSASKTTFTQSDYPIITTTFATGVHDVITSSSITYTSTSANYYTMQTLSYSGSIYTGSGEFNYLGNITGSIIGYADLKATSSYTASLNGILDDTIIVSGSYSGSYNNNTFKGYFSGSISGYANMLLSGSYVAIVDGTFTGNIYTQSISITTPAAILQYFYTASQYYYISSSADRHPINNYDSILYLQNNTGKYKLDSFVRFNIGVRDRYIDKTYSTSSNYLVIQYLPTSSYYSIIDGPSNTTIVPFSDFTKISADANINYINYHMGGLQPERQYKMIFKVISGSIEQYYDNNCYFKVVK
jgi:hypothetical protein